MKDEIRRAMDARLAALEGSEARRARIRARIDLAQRKEEPIMKRKLSLATALVLALMLLGGTALAAGFSLNLFELFGAGEERWLVVAGQAVLEAQEPVTVRYDSMEDVQAVMTNAHFDGTSLQVAYMVQGGLTLEPWEPTGEELARLEPMGKPYMLSGRPDILRAEPWSTGRQDLREEIERKEKEKQPVGFILREIRHDWELTASGVQVKAWMGEEQVLEDGTYYELIDYGLTIPEELSEKDALELSMPMSQTVSYYWFTGTQWYSRVDGPQEVGPLTATVHRTEPLHTARFSGTGDVHGVPVKVTSEINEVTGRLTVDAEEEMFYYGSRDGDNRLHVWLADLAAEESDLLRQGIQQEYSRNRLSWMINGSGTLPKELTLLLYEYVYGGPMTLEEARAQGTVITLKAEE